MFFRSVQITVVFLHEDAEFPERASHIFYQIVLSPDKSMLRPDRIIYGFFQNADHTGLNLWSCPGSGNRDYFFVYPETQNSFADYFNKKSCKVAPTPRPNDYYRPQ
jgi:hypothetical protein